MSRKRELRIGRILITAGVLILIWLFVLPLITDIHSTIRQRNLAMETRENLQNNNTSTENSDENINITDDEANTNYERLFGTLFAQCYQEHFLPQTTMDFKSGYFDINLTLSTDDEHKIIDEMINCTEEYAEEYLVDLENVNGADLRFYERNELIRETTIHS